MWLAVVGQHAMAWSGFSNREDPWEGEQRKSFFLEASGVPNDLVAPVKHLWGLLLFVFCFLCFVLC